MNKEHLLLLTPGFAADEADTTCIPALQLYVKELLSREQFEITIMAFHYPYKAGEYQWFKAKVIALGGKNKKGIHRLMSLRNAFRRVKKLQEIHPVNHLQSFWLGECAWMGQRLANAFSIRHCCTLMGQDALKLNWHIKRLKARPILIALSKYHAQKLYENQNLKADFIIPWGVDQTNKSLQNPNRSIDILGVGNLTPLKNFEQFIDIVGQLKADFPKIYTVIVGVGPQEKMLKKRINQSNLSDNIILNGKLDRELVLEKMSQAKCLLHTSRYESYGMVISEALSQGTKVFSTRVGISPEIESVKLFETNKQAINLLSEFLKQDVQHNAETPYLIADTVDSYINSVF